MTTEEITPEIAALLRSLVNNPHAIEDSVLLRLLMAVRMVMGSPSKVHITRAGQRALAAWVARLP